MEKELLAKFKNFYFQKGILSVRSISYNGRVFTNTGLKIPKHSTETEREKKADTRFEDFNPVFANTLLCDGALKINL